MIILLKPDVSLDGSEIEQILRVLRAYPGVTTRTHAERGQTRSLIEIYLIGTTAAIPKEPFEEFPGVEKVVRIRERYRAIGRHDGPAEGVGFEYNGVRFGQDTFHVFPGLCAVDTRENVEAMFARAAGGAASSPRAPAPTSRAPARTISRATARRACRTSSSSPASTASSVIAMEITHESHIDEIREALARRRQRRPA